LLLSALKAPTTRSGGIAALTEDICMRALFSS
jgi:hypothetical protein